MVCLLVKFLFPLLLPLLLLLLVLCRPFCTFALFLVALRLVWFVYLLCVSQSLTTTQSITSSQSLARSMLMHSSSHYNILLRPPGWACRKSVRCYCKLEQSTANQSLSRALSFLQKCPKLSVSVSVSFIKPQLQHRTGLAQSLAACKVSLSLSELAGSFEERFFPTISLITLSVSLFYLADFLKPLLPVAYYCNRCRLFYWSRVQ